MTTYYETTEGINFELNEFKVVVLSRDPNDSNYWERYRAANDDLKANKYKITHYYLVVSGLYFYNQHDYRIPVFELVQSGDKTKFLQSLKKTWIRALYLLNSFTITIPEKNEEYFFSKRELEPYLGTTDLDLITVDTISLHKNNTIDSMTRRVWSKDEYNTLLLLKDESELVQEICGVSWRYGALSENRKKVFKKVLENQEPIFMYDPDYFVLVNYKNYMSKDFKKLLKGMAKIKDDWKEKVDLLISLDIEAMTIKSLGINDG